MLQDLEYTYKGEINIPLRYYFSRNNENAKVNLHVTEKNHGFIPLNLCFRDYLRKHNNAKNYYEKLKFNLLQDPKSFQKIDGMFSGYALGKDKFIKDTLQKAGFNYLIVNFCMHYNEWQEYHLKIKDMSHIY